MVRIARHIFRTDNNNKRTKMATSLLRLGRLGSLKCLMRESWGTHPTPLVAALCTKADAPPKPAKKAKGASKTKERASVLAYKPTVAFPSKVSAAGLPKDTSLTESSAKTVTADAVLAAAATTIQPPSVTESATSEKLTKTTESAETVSSTDVDEITTDSPVADTAAEVTKKEAEITDIQHADKVDKASEEIRASEAETEVKQDQEDSSLSSSSDSDSDSDYDDGKFEKKPKSEPVDKSGEKAADENKDSVYKQKRVYIAEKELHGDSIIIPSASVGESPKDAQALKQAKPEELLTQSTEADSQSETLIDPAPILSSSMTKAIPEVTSESINVVPTDEMVDIAPEVKTTPTEDIIEKEPETKGKGAPEQAQETANVKANPKVESSPAKAIDAVSEVLQEVVVKPECEASSETVAKFDGATGIETTPLEDLKDAAPVTADAVESLAETPQEQAPVKAPEPEPEPFDNTTYKNLQHHQYNMYTFADMDVEMSKHRLPQPSSGRLSPSH
nr:cytadherence high molecular weight protein 1 isoform X1 [Misgurnus anguillicaudatus]